MAPAADQSAFADPDLELSDRELQTITRLVYEKSGITLGDAKRPLVVARLQKRLRAGRFASFAAYLQHVDADPSGDELTALLDAIATNHTSFFRESQHFDFLADQVVPEWLGRGDGAPLTGWSAPCSTGEEPYSVAIWLLENWPLVDRYEIEIVGSDIDTDVLETARIGLYGKRALMRLAPDLVSRYFVAKEFENWQILDDLRNSVQFTRVNVVDPSETRPHGRFDVIFCRNVLIYFDDASRRLAAENLYENLAPGGYICLGHAESMSRISPLFDVRRFDDAIVYQRPAEESHG